MGVGRRPQGRAQPGPRGCGVGHGLLGGEGLGDHHHQGLGGVEAGQRQRPTRPDRHWRRSAGRSAGRSGPQRLPDQPRARGPSRRCRCAPRCGTACRSRPSRRRSGRASAKAAIRARVASTSAETGSPWALKSAPFGARSAMCRAARPSEALTASPANRRVARGLHVAGARQVQRRPPGRPATRAVWKGRVSRPAASSRQPRQPVRLGVEQAGDPPVRRAGRRRLQPAPGRVGPRHALTIPLRLVAEAYRTLQP